MVYLEIASVLLLILLNGFFAMSELAVVSARKVRLQQMQQAGSRGAAAALKLQEDPGRFLSAVQIGITLIGVINGAVGGATLGERLGAALRAQGWLGEQAETVGIALVVVVITYVSLIIGELVPKRIALNSAEGIAAFAAPIMRAVSRATAPFVWLLGASTEGLIRLLRLPEKPESRVTEEEVKSMIAEGSASGVIEPGERRMIEGVMRLADRSVRSLMTPRLDMVWLDLDDDIETLRRNIVESRHSRIPVCRGSLDDVVGVVATRDLLDQLLVGGELDLRAATREALVVHDGTEVLRLLELFRQHRQQMAVVVDEYGSVEGVATLTDVLEAIAGELPGREDVEEDEVARRADGSFLLGGMLAVEEVEALLGIRRLRDPDGGYHTLAGFVLFRLGHLPKAGEQVEHEGWRFEVVDMDGRRIDKLLAAPVGPAQADDSASLPAGM
ncbi:hemolysin family protein [Indioceanicola profundi]|uniref:hemolysin family protein n=1 Tax=Indioceanicola profundi TaxID=2220096 RepID=UPI000E6A9666|nr:hemolysin family protein [Indioceanicola profundi]